MGFVAGVPPRAPPHMFAAGREADATAESEILEANCFIEKG
jgi:hypothetical protein